MLAAARRETIPPLDLATALQCYRAALGIGAPIDQRPKCEMCDTREGVELESSRTAYHFTGLRGGPDDPNKPVMLCRTCAKEHHEYWTEMWAEYYYDRF